MTSLKVSHLIESFFFLKYIHSVLCSLYNQDVLSTIADSFSPGEPSCQKNVLSLHACQKR